MKNIDNAKRMLAMALKDFKALRVMMDPDDVADEVFGFHIQQSVEKSIKAWLIYLNVDFPKTHDVRALLELLDSADVDVDNLWELIEYNSFGVQFRYQPFDDDGGFDRSEAVGKVQLLIDKVAALLK